MAFLDYVEIALQKWDSGVKRFECSTLPHLRDNGLGSPNEVDSRPITGFSTGPGVK